MIMNYMWVFIVALIIFWHIYKFKERRTFKLIAKRMMGNIKVSLDSEPFKGQSEKLMKDLNKAISETKKIKFDYNNFERTVHPYFLDKYRMFGWCEFKKEPRMFCLDNILSIDISKSTFTINEEAIQYLREEKAVKFVHAMSFRAWKNNNSKNSFDGEKRRLP